MAVNAQLRLRRGNWARGKKGTTGAAANPDKRQKGGLCGPPFWNSTPDVPGRITSGQSSRGGFAAL